LCLRFRERRELIEDIERRGRPKSTRTEVNIAAVADVVQNGHRIAPRLIAEFLDIPKSVFLRILKEDLRKRGLFARFIPHSLTTELREHRVTSCQDIIAMADADKVSLTNQTWRIVYDTKKIRQNSEWVGEISPRPKKLQFQKSRMKILLIIIF
jgi:hypothetical protein